MGAGMVQKVLDLDGAVWGQDAAVVSLASVEPSRKTNTILTLPTGGGAIRGHFAFKERQLDLSSTEAEEKEGR